MILYLDTSALMKKYTEELGSDIVRQAIASAYSIGISLIGRVEMAAALAKLIGVEALEYEEALAALQAFKKDWPHLIQLHTTKAVVARAESLACRAIAYSIFFAFLPRISPITRI
ncbi:MAG: type II toxin-antitoxin system VapC family toxin [Chloroflexi bacterium]|nr:type II toxin-antitoxin system VapC family toxin [Chloroflexota bacterium]